MAKEMRQDPVLGGWHEVEVENNKTGRSDRYLVITLCLLLFAGISNYLRDNTQTEEIRLLKEEIKGDVYRIYQNTVLIEKLETRIRDLENTYTIDRKNFHEWFLRDISRIEQIQKRLDKGEKK